MDLSEKALRKLLPIKEKCKICRGKGFSVKVENEERIFEDCECVKKIRTRLAYIEANIPLRHISWNMDQLTEEFRKTNATPLGHIEEYIKNLEENIDKGNSFWLSSAPGQAKSSIIGHLVKTAVDQGHRCYFGRASELHSKKFDALSDPAARRFIDFIVDEVDLLVIEEIDKIYLKDDLSMNNKLFFDLISDLYDSNKALIITSNEMKSAVLKRFPNFIADRFGEVNNYFFAGGKSGRR